MRFLAALLSFLMTTASLPAFAQSGQTLVPEVEPSQWHGLGSPLESPLRSVLAQNDEESADTARAQEIDKKLASLDQDLPNTRTTGPIIITSIGLGLAVGGGVGVIAVNQACDDARDDPNKRCDESKKDTIATVFGIVAGIGGAMAIAGGITWGSRASKRRGIVKQQRELQDERRGLSEALASLHLGTRVRGGDRYVTLGFDF